ncbi:aromatic alcohol reductase [Aspergillus stella-maris]|uniref:aromatic alcohol reductase n=1 Tax=Aspergillus stella-maris TaxID=1810926 RepID=UPI003CCCBE60
MSPFKKVALLGKGSLGTLVLDELLKSKFEVTILTRSAKSQSLVGIPPGATIKEVDYTSLDSLKPALTGHSVVISTLPPGAIALQKPIIDASIAVGVKRFIPAEFGAMTSDPVGKDLPFHADAVEIHRYLAEVAERGEIEFTVFAVGVFMHLLFTMPLAVDLKGRNVALFDNGEKRFSASRLSTVAKAVVASLGMSEESRNRLLRIHDAVLTQHKIYEFARKWTPGEDWSEMHLDAEEQVQNALVQLKQRFDPALIPGMFAAALFSGNYGGEYTNVDNELLGLGSMSDEEVEEFGLGLVEL